MNLLRVVRTTGWGVALAGACCLALRFIPGQRPAVGLFPWVMAANTAIAFVLTGSTLALLPSRGARWWVRVVSGGLLAQFGFYLCGLTMGRAWGPYELGNFLAGRPPVPAPYGLLSATAVTLAFVAVALALLAWRERIWASDALAGALGVVVGMIGVAALVGFATGKRLLFAADSVSMALSTAGLLVAMGAGLFAAASCRGEDSEEVRGGEVFSLDKKFSLGAGVALGVVTLMGLLSYNSTVKSLEAGRWLERAQGVQVSMDRLLGALREVELAERGYVLTGEAAWLELYASANMEAASARAEVTADGLGAVFPVGAWERLEAMMARQLAEQDAAIEHRREGLAPEEMQALMQSSRGQRDAVGAELIALKATVREEMLRRTAGRGLGRRKALVIYAGAVGAVAAILLGVHAFVERDLSGRRRADAALRRRNETLQSFAHTVAHDLRAPLRGLVGYSRELSQHHAERLDEHGLYCVRQIAGSARNLDRLIEDTLDFARLDAEMPQLTEVDLPRLVATLLRERAPQIRELGAELTTHFGVLRVVSWERGLGQVLGNLFDNALKYSREARPPRIHLETLAQPEGWRLVVRDNGIGFDPKHRERIFGLFQRLPEAAAYEGTGAGLAITKKIVDRLGGEVRADSQRGAGATFTVDLPRTAAGVLN